MSRLKRHQGAVKTSVVIFFVSPVTFSWVAGRWKMLTNLFVRSWNGIISPKVPGVAAEYPLYPKENSLVYAVLFNSSSTVGAARWIETAKARSRQLSQEPVIEREGSLVKIYEDKNDSFEHFLRIFPLFSFVNDVKK